MDKLIYGKNTNERIVSIEVINNQTEVFVEDFQGNPSSYFLPNKFWILAAKQPDSTWVRMSGNLHYKYGKQFVDRKEYFEARKLYYKYDLFSIYDPKEAIMCKDGITYFKGMKHFEVSTLSFDIEATGLEHDENAKVLLIANTFRKNGKIIRRLFSYNEYESEADMLEHWCIWVRQMNPSIILGHNIFTYDFPYLQFLAEKYNIKLNLGRNGSEIHFEDYESKFRKDASQFYHYHKIKIYGRELIDTMFLAVKYDVGRKYESYALKSIIKHEALEVKDRVFYDAQDIRFNYKDPIEFEKIKKYAEHDGDDALALYDLMSPPFFYMTQSIPKPYQLVLESATGSQINSMMIRSYLQEGHSLPKASESAEYVGATSFGNPGIYRNVGKSDAASLYPSIILEYKVCDILKDPNKNFLGIVETFTRERLNNKKLAKETKDPYYDALQQAGKQLINSAYGFLGTSGLLFNSPDKAAFITRKGREILQKSIDWANSKNFIIVNGDTDSISFCKADQSEITEQEQKDLLIDLNSIFPERIRFEADGYFKTVIIIKTKNYILWDGKKITYKGSAIKASLKEPALKQFIKDLVQEMLDNTNNFNDVYLRYTKEILNVQDIKRWACKKTITQNVLEGERTNETKVKDAIKDSEYVEGDKCYMFFKSDKSLSLVEDFDGDYDKKALLKKLYNTAEIFSTVIDKSNFLNYSLKRNEKLLEEL